MSRVGIGSLPSVGLYSHTVGFVNGYDAAPEKALVPRLQRPPRRLLIEWPMVICSAVARCTVLLTACILVARMNRYDPVRGCPSDSGPRLTRYQLLTVSVTPTRQMIMLQTLRY